MRNYNLDLLKILAMFGIVVGHIADVHTILGGAIAALGCIGCPVFFLISGYYSKNFGEDRVQMLRKVWHFGQILVVGMLLALLYDLICSSMWKITFEKLCVFLFTNACYFWETSQPVWFLAAMIYVYLVGYVTSVMVSRPITMKTWGVIAGILFLAFYVLEYLHMYGDVGESYYYRNFLFEALPYFLVGKLLKDANFIFNVYIKEIRMLIVAGGG